MNEWTDYPHANCCPCHTTRKIAYSVNEAAANEVFELMESIVRQKQFPEVYRVVAAAKQST